MNHSFNIEEAVKYGLEEAILLENMRFWISKNIASGKHYYDGKTWTYNSARAFSLLFPYMSEQKIRRRLQSLIEQGVIITGNYNKVGYDRTLWYAFSDISILQNRQMEESESTNGLYENEEPIPDINTDIKPDNKHIDALDIDLGIEPEKAEKRNGFKKPTIKEIQGYIDAKELKNITAIDFYEYYESNGWIVGKVKMKDWKLTANRWNRNTINKDKSKTKEEQRADAIYREAMR